MQKHIELYWLREALTLKTEIVRPNFFHRLIFLNKQMEDKQPRHSVGNLYMEIDSAILPHTRPLIFAKYEFWSSTPINEP